MLSSLLAMKLELKICFHIQVSGRSEREAARSSQKAKRHMYCGFATEFNTSSSRKKARVKVMEMLILGQRMLDHLETRAASARDRQ